MDSYYCDTDWTNCVGWKEVDLDTGARPLAYITLNFFSISNAPLSSSNRVYTDSAGKYSYSWQTPSGTLCAGQVAKMTVSFRRVNEAHLGVAAPYFRFEIVDQANEYAHNAGIVGQVTLNSSAATLNAVFKRSATPGYYNKIASMYYTVNSAIAEMKSWSSRVNSYLWGGFGFAQPLKIVFDPGGAGFANDHVLENGDHVFLNASLYLKGARVRHELGHVVQSAVHDHKKAAWGAHGCASYSFGYSIPGHSIHSCEYGQVAVEEGLATFYAVRSITVGDRSAFYCECGGLGAFQDTCSETIPVALADTEREVNCVGTAQSFFLGVGDDYADSKGDCLQLYRESATPASSPGLSGCICSTAPGSLVCDGDFFKTEGWRNEMQVTRFMWDVVDTSTDAKGQEISDSDIQTVIGGLQSMHCAADEWHVNGSCNEPNGLKAPYDCMPAIAGPPPAAQRASRDSYNVWDVANAVPGDQGVAREINCALGAED